jgi:CRP/FNR family transcriptional regulator
MAISRQEVREHFPSLTSHINDSAIDALISTAEECRFSGGETVIQDNSPLDKLFFILDGYLSSYIERNGEKLELGEIAPGDFAGEVSLFGNCPTTATVVAKTDCQLLTLSKTGLEQLQTSNPQLVSRLLRIISGTLASRLLTTDKLLYQRLVGESPREMHPGDTSSFIAWCTGLYKRMHGRQEMSQ